MTAPYLINNVSVVGDFFRNAESESGSSIVWKRDSTYTVEYLREINLQTSDIDPNYPAVPREDIVWQSASLRFLDIISPSLNFFWKNNFSKSGIVGSGAIDRPLFTLSALAVGELYGYVMSNTEIFRSPFSWSDTLDEDDIATGINWQSSDVTDRPVPGPVWGGSGGNVVNTTTGVVGTGQAWWTKLTFQIASNARLGQAWMNSAKTTAAVQSPTPIGTNNSDITWGNSGFSENLMVQIEESTWQEPVEWPSSRDNLVGYDPDAVWDPKTSDWGVPTDLTTLGGGRYNQQVVALGHRSIYYEELS